jgi:hypothetical protein
MTLNKKLFNCKVVDHIENYNFYIYYMNYNFHIHYVSI